jgi:hypothetical protein
MDPTTRLLQAKDLVPNDGMVLLLVMYVQDNFQLGMKRKRTSHRTKAPSLRALLPRFLIAPSRTLFASYVPSTIERTLDFSAKEG